MTKKEKIYAWSLAGLFVLLVIIEYLQPKPLDWSRTYKKEDKIPYGDYLLYNMLETFDKDISLKSINKSYFELKNTDSLITDSADKHFLFIGDDYRPDDIDSDVLLEQVANGATAFIVAKGYNYNFSDTLDFTINRNFYFESEDKTEEEKKDQEEKVSVNLTNVELAKVGGYTFDLGITDFYFSSFDSSSFYILGTNQDDKANFISRKWGKGRIYLHSNPLVFTNYYMMSNDGAEYISSTLSYLPKGTILWDEYNKGVKIEPQTPLRFILSQPSLKWAWFLALFLMVMWMLFQSKRKQKKIKVVTPPENTSLEFVETISQLYFQQKQHHQLVHKKVKLFRDFLRRKYFIRPELSREETIKKLEMQTGLSEKELQEVFNLIDVLENKQAVSESELLMLEEQTNKLTF
ncbi:MAG: hypothetical protein CMO01_29050 [Thalassobius sp.]|nr:hypothetical protein [Thalassovita sp.]